MSAVADTSALVSLTVANMLDESAKDTGFSVPTEVVSELKELNKYEDVVGQAAEIILNFISENNIKHLPLENPDKIESLISSDIQHGEAACFLLCVEQNIKILIMDDVDAAFALEGIARSKNITIRISVAVVVELYKRRKITRKQLKAAVDTMIKLRRWEEVVLEVLARKYIK